MPTESILILFNEYVCPPPYTVYFSRMDNFNSFLQFRGKMAVKRKEKRVKRLC